MRSYPHHDAGRQQHIQYFTRRKVCQDMLTLGVIGSSLPLCLSSCYESTQYNIPLLWHREEDEDMSFNTLVSQFNQFYSNIQVKSELLTPNQDQSVALNSHDDIVKYLQSDPPYRPDILSLDVVWMSEFVAKDWIIPLDQYWPQEKRVAYLPIPLKVVEINGKIWAAPLHTDIGVLFYRTDVISSPPQTWDDLQRMALDAQASGKTRYGYVWQGKEYEGLVCHFIEVLSSFGGNIFDPQNSQKVVINSPEAKQALQTMRNWIHGPNPISPPDVLAYDETATTNVWDNGDAAFMRNWPSRFFWSSDARQTRVAEEFTVTQLPSGTRSCLGGWQLAINKFSPYQDQAWTFIEWMLQSDAQKHLAAKEAFPVTLQSVYNDKYINQLNPFYRTLPSIVQHAQWRPTSPYYPEISAAIQHNIHQALAQPDQISPDQAIQNLQHDLETIVAKHR